MFFYVVVVDVVLVLDLTQISLLQTGTKCASSFHLREVTINRGAFPTKRLMTPRELPNKKRQEAKQFFFLMRWTSVCRQQRCSAKRGWNIHCVPFLDDEAMRQRSIHPNVRPKAATLHFDLLSAQQNIELVNQRCTKSKSLPLKEANLQRAHYM